MEICEKFNKWVEMKILLVVDGSSYSEMAAKMLETLRLPAKTEVAMLTVVPEDVSLEYVVTRFAREPSVREIFLIDASERFLGVITRNDLMKWARIRLFGGKGRL